MLRKEFIIFKAQNMELKRLLNKSEEATNTILKEVCEEWGAHVFIKVRLADVFPIEGSGIAHADYHFVLQSHFDFIVTNADLTPLFAVEFDSAYHLSDVQRRRDAQKDALCVRFECPLLRINTRYLCKDYRDMDLLSWFVHMWFASEMLTLAQAEGSIPRDEPLDAQWLGSVSGRSDSFPLLLSLDIRSKLQALAESGKCWDSAPACVIGKDTAGNYHAIGWLRVSPSTAVLVKTAMRNQMFPISVRDILREIVAFALYQRLLNVLAGTEHPISQQELKTETTLFKKRYEFAGASTVVRKTST
jgi:hypothetical protein